MAKPSKPIQLVKGHRTKKEIEVRKKAEASLVSGSSFKEWEEVKKNKIAHKEFTRLKKIYKAIKKDDALHESIINRYCLLHAECNEYEVMKEKLYNDLNDERFINLDFMDRINLQTRLQDKIMQCDKKIMDKRTMMLNIEKENIMTIASVLRSIPKKPEDEETINPMASFLNRR